MAEKAEIIGPVIVDPNQDQQTGMGSEPVQDLASQTSEPSVHEQIAQRLAESRRQRQGSSEILLTVSNPETLPSPVTPPISNEPAREPDQTEITVKVYGQSYQVPKSEVDEAGGVEAYQKRAAAAELLRRTNEERKAFKEEQKKWYEERSTSLPKTKPTEELIATDDPRAEELARAYLQAQDAEDYKGMANTLREIAKLANDQSKPVDQSAILEMLDARDRESDRNQGTAWFDTSYPHLAQDGTLRNMVSQRVASIEKTYPHVPPSKVIAYVADEVDAWYRKISNGGVHHQPTTPNDRIAAKQNMNTPIPASQRKEPPPEKRRATVAEVVAEMKKRRGQFD